MNLFSRLFGTGCDEETAGRPPFAGTRFYARLPLRAAVSLLLQDAEQGSRMVETRSVDISELGIRVDSPEPLPPGAPVFVHASAIPVTTAAFARHCGQRGSRFHIGLEFQNPITRDLPQLKTRFRVIELWRRWSAR